MLDRLTANSIIENMNSTIQNACVTIMLVSKEIPFEELNPKAQSIVVATREFLNKSNT